MNWKMCPIFFSSQHDAAIRCFPVFILSIIVDKFSQISFGILLIGMCWRKWGDIFFNILSLEGNCYIHEKF